MIESQNPDLEGTPCSRTDCLRVADVIGRAVIKLDVLVGATNADDPMTLDVPLCIPDAHLLRMGGTLLSFDEGMA